jgi:hypothetical protein
MRKLSLLAVILVLGAVVVGCNKAEETQPATAAATDGGNGKAANTINDAAVAPPGVKTGTP